MKADWIGIVAIGAVGILFRLMPGMWQIVKRYWLPHVSLRQKEKYSCVYPRQQAVEVMWESKKKQITLCYMAVLAGAMLSVLSGYASQTGLLDSAGIVTRGEFGQAQQQLLLQVTAEKEGQKIRRQLALVIAPKEPTEEQLEQLFAAVYRELEMLFPEKQQDNHYRISQDLKLPDKAQGNVTVSWESTAPGLLSIYGVLGSEIPEEGKEVILTAVADYDGMQSLFSFPCMVYPKEDLRTLEQRLADYLKEVEQQNRTEDLQLPAEYEGYQLAFKDKNAEGVTPVVWLLFGSVLAVLAYFSYGQQIDKAYEERKEQMSRDYPEIVSKLAVLTGAGMTPRRAWERMVQDYEKQQGKMRYGYEEMRRTYIGLQNGVYESSAYGEFGRRCGIYCYQKLGMLLEQNMQKGLSDLPQQLQAEMLQAFETRKLLARQEGEKARTRLLFPMMLLLLVVIIIVMVPAWLSMGI